MLTTTYYTCSDDDVNSHRNWASKQQQQRLLSPTLDRSEKPIIVERRRRFLMQMPLSRWSPGLVCCRQALELYMSKLNISMCVLHTHKKCLAA